MTECGGSRERQQRSSQGSRERIRMMFQSVLKEQIESTGCDIKIPHAFQQENSCPCSGLKSLRLKTRGREGTRTGQAGARIGSDHCSCA